MNFLALVVLMLVGAENYRSLVGPALALIYCAVMPALAFFAWHWVLYRAIKSDASFLYIVYFVTFAIQLVFYAFIGLGIFNGGGGYRLLSLQMDRGILTAIDMFVRAKIIAGTICIFCSLVVACCFLLGLVLIRQVAAHYRYGSHSLGRARDEAARAAASNRTVRQAARDAVTSIV